MKTLMTFIIANFWFHFLYAGDVVVAVIDTGADIHHPAIKHNIWTNSGESGIDQDGRSKANNGRDDDGNGFVDDVYGWSFTAKSGNVQDVHGHGTHVSGIIARESRSPHVRLMILNYYSKSASTEDNIDNTVNAIDYAIKNGAKIINYSSGGRLAGKAEEAAIKRAQDAGVLLVAAAGNEKSDTDRIKYYPAGYTLSNILSVTAHNSEHQILPSSNFGFYSVDLAAPGKDIYSSVPGGKFANMTGTSQAAAFATAAIARVLVKETIAQKPETLITRILNTVDEKENLKSKTLSSGILNPERILKTKGPYTSATGRPADSENEDLFLITF